MSDSLTTATPETKSAAPMAHPPVRENQMEVEVDRSQVAGQRVMRAIGGGSPEAPPEQFAGALAGMEGRSQAGMLRQLQRSYGNSYVGSIIQAKLTVGQPGDVYEQEADKVADAIMRMPELPVSVGSGVTNHVQPMRIQRMCATCQHEEEEQIRPKEAVGQVPTVTPALETRLNATSGGGEPLSESVRTFMEPRIGADFSGVRVHTGGEANALNQELTSQAFTRGRDIYFGAGKAPAKDTLTAHELTHVVQQSWGAAEKSVIHRAPPDTPLPAATPSGTISTDKSLVSSLDTIAIELYSDITTNASAHRERILQNMLRVNKQSEDTGALKRLYKEKSPNKDADLIADLKSGLNSGDFIRAQSYFNYGKLRTVDKIYLAAKGAGTDWPTIERMLPEVHENFIVVEAAFWLDYREDYPTKSRLPNGQQSGIAGLIDDEFPSGNDAPEAIKGKAVIAFGEPQPLDLVRAATDSDTMLRSLQQAMQAFESVKSLKKSYSERYPDSLLEKHLENKLSGDDLKRYKMILSGTYTARKRIELAMGGGIDPDEKQIWSAFQDATSAEIEELRKEYKNQGGIYKMFKGGIFTGLSKENLLRAEAMLGAGPEGEDPVLTKLKAQGGVNGREIVKVIKNALKSDWKEYHDAYLKGTGSLRTFADELLDADGKGQVASYLQDSALSRIKYGIDHQDVEYVTLQVIAYASEEEKKSILGDATLMGNIASYFNAREANKIRGLLIPANLSPEEKAKLLGDKISRESSLLFGATANAEALEDEQRELGIALEKAKVDGKLTPEEQKKIEQLTKQTEGALAAYMGVRDELNEYLETALDIAASFAVAVATGGAGAPMLAGAVARAALAQAVVSVVVKKIVHGDNFDVLSPEAVGVFAAGFVDGAMNAVGGKAAEKAVSAALRDSARATALETGNVVFKSSGRRILTQTAEGVISNSPGAMVRTAVDDGTWKEGFAKGFGAVLESGVMAGAQGTAMNLGMDAGKGFIKAIKGIEDATGLPISHELGMTSKGIERCSDGPTCLILADSLRVRANKLNQIPADADVNWFMKQAEIEPQVKELKARAEDINIRAKASFNLSEIAQHYIQIALLREAEQVELEMVRIEHQFYGVSGKQLPAAKRGKWGPDGKGIPGEGDWYPNPDDPVFVYTNGKPIKYDAKFPNLTPWSLAEVSIPMKGQEIDFDMADIAGAAWAFRRDPQYFGKNGLPDVDKFRLWRTEFRYTWHHKENGVTMQLIPTDLHSRIPHLGGSSLSRGIPK